MIETSFQTYFKNDSTVATQDTMTVPFYLLNSNPVTADSRYIYESRISRLSLNKAMIVFI